MPHNSEIKSHIESDSRQQTLIDELEAAVANRNIGSRADVLRQITDLFVVGSSQYDAEQIALFDDVMGRLVEEIDSSARAAFGERISKIANAPINVSRRLALDNSIEVAGQVLTHSNQLDDTTLIAGAKTKSQEHLLAISRRKSLSEDVTDVLIERGNNQVVANTVGNLGARFSESGYSTLVSKSGGDAALALTIWSRSDIPREHLLALFEKASVKVREKLEAADREKASLIHEMVRGASDQLRKQTRGRSAIFMTAQSRIQSMYVAGLLTEDTLRECATACQFDETIVALSLLTSISVDAVERIMVTDNVDQILLAAKSIDLSWETTKAILTAQTVFTGRWIYDLEQHHTQYKKLKTETARTAIQFSRLRERSAAANLK